MFEKEQPDENERRKAQCQLDRLRQRKQAYRKEPERGGADGATPARYFAAVDPSEDPSEIEF